MSTVKKVTSERVLTPSEEIINSKNVLHEITDENGRSITIKEPKLIDQFKLVRALGRDAENSVLSNMFNPILWLKSLDGVPFSLPTSTNEMMAAIGRLDSEGYIAITDFITNLITEKTEGGKSEAKEDLKK